MSPASPNVGVLWPADASTPTLGLTADAHIGPCSRAMPFAGIGRPRWGFRQHHHADRGCRERHGGGLRVRSVFITYRDSLGALGAQIHQPPPLPILLKVVLSPSARIRDRGVLHLEIRTDRRQRVLAIPPQQVHQHISERPTSSADGPTELRQLLRRQTEGLGQGLDRLLDRPRAQQAPALRLFAVALLAQRLAESLRLVAATSRQRTNTNRSSNRHPYCQVCISDPSCQEGNADGDQHADSSDYGNNSSTSQEHLWGLLGRV